MDICLRVDTRLHGTFTGNQLGKIQGAFPGFEAALIEVRLEVTLLQTSDQLGIIVVCAVLCHQLGADVDYFSARDDNGCLADSEPIVKYL